MPNLTIQIHDVATGEIINREMTDEEQQQFEAERAMNSEAKRLREEQAAQLRATKISAYQKLGLTAEEIEALLPTPKPKPE
jgi:cell division protein FtsL